MMNHPFGTGTPSQQQTGQFNGQQRGHFGGGQQFGQNTGYANNNDLYAQMQMMQQQQQMQYINGFNNNPSNTSPAPNVLGGRDSYSNPSPSGRVVINPQQNPQQLQQLLSQQAPTQYSMPQQHQGFGGPNTQQGFVQNNMPIQQAQQSYNIIGGQGGYGNNTGPVMSAMLNTNLNSGVQRSSSFSVDQIKTVQLLIEQCLKSYLSQTETISCLCRHIEPGFINLMWQKLEQQNPEFFKAYNIRIKIKDQINIFNELVNDQAQMMKQEGVLVQNNATPTTPTTNAPPNAPKTNYGRQSATPSPSQSPTVFDNRRTSATVTNPSHTLINPGLRDGMMNMYPKKENMQSNSDYLQEKKQLQDLHNMNNQLLNSLNGSSSIANQLRRSDSMPDSNQDLVQQHQILMQQIHQMQQSNVEQSQERAPPPTIQPPQYIPPTGMQQPSPQNIMTSPSHYLNPHNMSMNSPPFSMLRNNSESNNLDNEFYNDDSLVGLNSEVGSLFNDDENYNNSDINGFFLDEDK